MANSISEPHDTSSLRIWFEQIQHHPISNQLGRCKALLFRLFTKSEIGLDAAPTTSNSSHAIAGAWALADLQDAHEGDEVKLLLMLKPQWVKDQLEKVDKVPQNSQGCWLRNTTSNENRPKINWRNTKHSAINTLPQYSASFGKKFSTTTPNSNILLSHAAYYINGRFDSEALQLIAQHGNMEVSHLCHNSRCFNPKHVIVEPKQDNRSREACHGSVAFYGLDGTVLTPCPHRDSTQMKKGCILQIVYYQPGIKYKSLQSIQQSTNQQL